MFATCFIYIMWYFYEKQDIKWEKMEVFYLFGVKRMVLWLSEALKNSRIYDDDGDYDGSSSS